MFSGNGDYDDEKKNQKQSPSHNEPPLIFLEQTTSVDVRPCGSTASCRTGCSRRSRVEQNVQRCTNDSLRLQAKEITSGNCQHGKRCRSSHIRHSYHRSCPRQRRRCHGSTAVSPRQLNRGPPNRSRKVHDRCGRGSTCDSSGNSNSQERGYTSGYANRRCSGW